MRSREMTAKDRKRAEQMVMSAMADALVGDVDAIEFLVGFIKHMSERGPTAALLVAFSMLYQAEDDVLGPGRHRRQRRR